MRAFRHSDHWTRYAGSAALFGDSEGGNARSIVGVWVPRAFFQFKTNREDSVLQLACRLYVVVSDDLGQVRNITCGGGQSG